MQDVIESLPALPHVMTRMTGLANVVTQELMALPQMMDQAAQLLDAGELEAAERLFLRAAMVAPSLAAVHWNLCKIYRRLRRHDDAITSGRRAVSLAPKEAGIIYELACALTDVADHRAAAEQYRRVLDCDPGHGSAMTNLGASLEELGEEQDVEEWYLRAIQINPHNETAHNNRGLYLRHRGDVNQAGYILKQPSGSTRPTQCRTIIYRPLNNTPGMIRIAKHSNRCCVMIAACQP